MSSHQKPRYLQKLVRSQIRNFIEQVNEKKQVSNPKKKRVKKVSVANNISTNKKNQKTSRYISKSTRVSVLHRDKYKCVFCGRSSQQIELQIDHIIPFSRGGSNQIDNLQTLCVDCNQGKSDRIL
ncbi:MAG: HNH endonuclease [Cyanobacteria bacterium P01_G01_bin.39]